jgi:hypothetical protein
MTLFKSGKSRCRIFMKFSFRRRQGTLQLAAERNGEATAP